MKLVVSITLLLSISIIGCKSSKNTTTSDGGKVGSKKVVEILSNIQEKESQSPKFLAFKADAVIKTEEKSTSVKASIRMVKDSAIWISITSFKYEAVRILATPDSIKYLSRTEKKYYVGGYDFIQTKLGVDFGFDEIQALLLAQSFGLKEAQSVSKRNDRKHYVLSALNKKEAKNIPEGMEWQTPDVEVLYSNWVNPETFQIEKVNLQDVNTQHNASIQYLTFENISDYLLLSSFSMNIIAKTSTDVSVSMHKFSVEGPLKFPFQISSKYEQIVK